MNGKRIAAIVVVVWCLLTVGCAWAGGFANGTLTFNSLVWLKNADCFGQQNFDQATNSCAGLKTGSCGLSDGSTVGQWRLPNKDELIEASKYSLSFSNDNSSYYWSSTTSSVPNNAWSVYFDDGRIFVGNRDYVNYVLCVHKQQ